MLINANGPLNVDRFHRQISDRRPGGLVIDLQAATFVDMYCLVEIATSAVGATTAGGEVSFIPPRGASVGNYLSRMGLKQALQDHGIICPLPEVRSTPHPASLVSLHGFEDDSGLSKLSDLLATRMSKRPSLKAHLAPLVEALWELGSNVVEHACSPGFAVAQVYNSRRHSERIDLVIGDAGVGIRKSFASRGRYVPRDDLHAIDLALAYLVSSLEDEGRGQGLTLTVGETLQCKGKAVIRTGAGRSVRTTRGKHDARVPFLRGTTILLSIPCA